LNIISLGIKYLVDNIDNIRLQSHVDELRESLLDIQESSDVAICTLNNILAFETLDTGELTLITKETSPISFIQSSVKMFKIQAAHAGVELKCDGPDCLPSSLDTFACLVDTNKLGQVIRNLVSNALKFTKCGGSVTVRAYHKVFELNSLPRRQVTGALTHLYSPSSVLPDDRDYLVIEVEDTGIGISEVCILLSFILRSHRLSLKGRLSKALHPSDTIRYNRYSKWQWFWVGIDE
jgi:signal transduction histidine kinase